MFKYKTELDQISSKGAQCPPEDATPIDGEAWRWVSNPINADCFDPQAIRYPPRLAKAKQKDDLVEECSCWALSMHVSKDKSIAAFKALEASIPKARKLFGGHVVGAKLTPDFGKATTPESNGHFDLHQYVGADFLAVFKFPQVIP